MQRVPEIEAIAKKLEIEIVFSTITIRQTESADEFFAETKDDEPLF